MTNAKMTGHAANAVHRAARVLRNVRSNPITAGAATQMPAAIMNLYSFRPPMRSNRLSITAPDAPSARANSGARRRLGSDCHAQYIAAANGPSANTAATDFFAMAAALEISITPFTRLIVYSLTNKIPPTTAI